MKIYALTAFDDNYIWVLIKDGYAIVVDAGQAEPVLDFLRQQGLDLKAILITHHHHDHIGGVPKLLECYPNAQVFAHQGHGLLGASLVDEGDTITLLGEKFVVWKSAGHTDSHLSYLYYDDKWHVFCGDTLFSGGCGRVFTGTIKELFDSLTRFNTLPADTLFYPAHEYTLANLQFALAVSPPSYQHHIQQAIDHAKAKLAKSQMTVPTVLQKERQINVFLCVNDQALSEHIARLYPEYQEQLTSPLALFTILRELKNQF